MAVARLVARFREHFDSSFLNQLMHYFAICRKFRRRTFTFFQVRCGCGDAVYVCDRDVDVVKCEMWMW